jgi:hypothetical protein
VFHLNLLGDATRALAPGTRLEPHEILSLLGVGGMGEVYRTQDTRLERTVAIKILSQLSYDPARKQRFEREARAISQSTVTRLASESFSEETGPPICGRPAVENQRQASHAEAAAVPEW